MRDWKDVAVAADIDIYFCDPHAPWQRGTNENTNGLLRQYFPKGSDLSEHDEAMLDLVAAELNDRPRKRLGFRKPVEEIAALFLAAEDHPGHHQGPDHTSTSVLIAANPDAAPEESRWSPRSRAAARRNDLDADQRIPPWAARTDHIRPKQAATNASYPPLTTVAPSQRTHVATTARIRRPPIGTDGIVAEGMVTGTFRVGQLWQRTPPPRWSRYCPTCLADPDPSCDGNWQSPLSLLCLRHGNFLLNTCPRLRCTPARQARMDVPAAGTLALPLRVHRSRGGPPTVHLRYAPTQPADRDLQQAQHLLNGMVRRPGRARHRVRSGDHPPDRVPRLRGPHRRRPRRQGERHPAVGGPAATVR